MNPDAVFIGSSLVALGAVIQTLRAPEHVAWDSSTNRVAFSTGWWKNWDMVAWGQSVWVPC